MSALNTFFIKGYTRLYLFKDIQLFIKNNLFEAVQLVKLSIKQTMGKRLCEMISAMSNALNVVPPGCGHPELVIHGGNHRLLLQHHCCGYHHGSHAGHFCRNHRILCTGQTARLSQTAAFLFHVQTFQLP